MAKIKLSYYPKGYLGYFQPEIEWNYPSIPHKGDNFHLDDFVELPEESQGLTWQVEFVMWESWQGKVYPVIYLINQYDEIIDYTI